MNATKDMIESVARGIEGILTRRIWSEKLDGYTLEASQELARAATNALERRIKQLERIERHARKMLNYDGGEGSVCYHASKVFDARKALLAALLEEPTP